MARKILAVGLGVMAAAAAGMACSSSTQAEDEGFGSGSGSEAGSGNLGGGAGVPEGPVFSNGGAPSYGGGFGVGGDPVGGEACETQVLKAEPMPVDMFFMFDQSSSMNDLIPGSTTRWWDAAVQAVATFVDQPGAAGLGMGIQYFPLNGVEPDSCTAPYSTAEVEVGLLPGVGQAIKNSIFAHAPTTFTPSGPALQGAIDHMKAYAKPGRAPAVVFVTDGFPTECQPRQVSDIAALAKAALDTEPKVRTFVVGFSQGLENLDQIAKAGGTGNAFLISGGNVGEQFVQALLSISSTTLQCDFEVPAAPAGQELKFDLVRMLYTPNATQVTQQVPKLRSLGDCDITNGQGWYYDHPTTPTKLIACPGTCAGFAAGIVKISYGCEPITGGPS